jgi:hypothetical protein
MAERIVFNSNASKNIDAYLEYVNIVGDADGGKMMSEKEYEEFKNKVKESRKNKLYVSWRNISGKDCKMIGQASTCFWGHRYKTHNFDNVKTKKVDCRESKCGCKLFSYVPVYGSQDLKCLWKHSCKIHDPKTRKCTKPGCKWGDFSSKHPWSCGLNFNDHETVFESREERVAEGRPVDPKWMQDSNMIGGSGGITSFMGLVEGGDIDKMQDPNAILGNVQGSIGGYAALQALEGEHEEFKGAHGAGTVSKSKSGAASTKSAYDLFHTPHSFGTPMKAIGGPAAKKKAVSSKYR